MCKKTFVIKTEKDYYCSFAQSGEDNCRKQIFFVAKLLKWVNKTLISHGFAAYFKALKRTITGRRQGSFEDSASGRVFLTKA